MGWAWSPEGPSKKGECVAVIPRSAILCCSNVPGLTERVQRDHTLHPDSASSMIPLILTLAAEYSNRRHVPIAVSTGTHLIEHLYSHAHTNAYN